MSADLPLTPEDVGEIVAILDGTDYDRMEIRTTRFVLRVARQGAGWTQEWDWSASTENQAAETAPQIAPAADQATPDGLAGIHAPLPGTFYRAPQPGAPAFVEMGDVVMPESVIGIVETMKLMTPVHAGAAGRIAAILVENAAPVAEGAVLMHLSPT